MRIKRFEAKDTQTALAMVKAAMGEDAVILATRTLNTKKHGIKSSKPMIEIVAAMDYDLDALEIEDQLTNDAAPAERTQTYNYQTIRKKEPKQMDRMPPQPVASDSIHSNKEKNHSEAHDLRLRFANILKHSPSPKQSPKQPRNGSNPKKPGAQSTRKKPSQAEITEWRDQLINKIQLKNTPDGPPENKEQTVIALVGSTGVGKTTTAAKMAAWHSLRLGKKVALLSMDCYRIGATDQLRTYARIMRLPCEIALRKPDLTKALNRHANKDVIIIDTAGKNPYDTAHIDELKEWFYPVERIEPHLVLSATTKKEDLHSVLHSYADLSLASLILTKLDETRAYAALCQQVVASSLPVSYLCTGQRVPEDFLVASKNFLDTLFKHGWNAAADQISQGVH